MVRLATTNDENGTTKTNFRLNVSFWSLVGAVMVALKLKEHYEDCESFPWFLLDRKEKKAEISGTDQQVPPSPNGATNPLVRPASYRDDDDIEAASQIGLDTTVNMPSRTRTKRKKGCCVCCGVK